MKKNVYILSFSAFVVNLGFGAAMPLIPFLLLAFDGLLTDLPENLGTIENASQIAFQMTVLVAAFMLTRAMFARHFGRLSDVVGRKRIVVIGLALYTVLAFAYTLVFSWIGLLVVRATQGVASAMVWPVAEAMITDSVSSSERGKYMGWYMTLSNISYFIGPSMGAYLYKIAAFNLYIPLPYSLLFPFYILTILSLVGLILSLFTVETISAGKRKNAKYGIFVEKTGKVKIKLPPRISRSLKVIYIMGFANGIAMGFVAPVSQIFVIEFITADPSAIGLLSTVSGFAGFLVTYPAGIISDKIGRKKIIISGQLASRTATFFVPFVKDFNTLLTIYSGRVMAFNIMSPPYRALQADLVPKEMRGDVFGTVQTLFNFGAAFAPLGGLLYQIASEWSFNIFGYTVPGVAVSFWLSAFIGFFTTALFILFVHEPKEEEKEYISAIDRDLLSKTPLAVSVEKS